MLGNISGRYTSHNSLSGCPLAHAKVLHAAKTLPPGDYIAPHYHRWDAHECMATMQGLVPFKAHKKGYAKLQKEFERTELMKNGEISAEVLTRPLSASRSPLPRASRARFVRAEIEDEDKWPKAVPTGLCSTQRYEVAPEAVSLFEQSLEAYRGSLDAPKQPRKGKGKAQATPVKKQQPTESSAMAVETDGGGAADDDAIRPPRIEIANFAMDAWYSSPFPDDFRGLPCVYVCEFTLQFMKSKTEVQQHNADFRHNGYRPCPPGEEIYREGKISVWEVDGRRHRVYCQNL